MEFFLKRVPAFSRALGDSETDDDDVDAVPNTCITEDTPYTNHIGLPVDVQCTLADKIIKKIIVAIGPLHTTFFTISLSLCEENIVFRLPYTIPDYEGALNSPLQYIDVYFAGSDTVVITVPEHKPNYHINQKLIVRRLLDTLLPTIPKTTSYKSLDMMILCSRSIYHYQSSTVSSDSFIRTLCNDPFSQYTSHPSTWPLLEQPNIILGFPAEFLTYAINHNLPAILIALFFVPQDDPKYAWPVVRELFDILRSPPNPEHNALLGLLTSGENKWADLSTSSPLRKDCVTLLCGRKPTLTDQMYT